MRLLTLIWCPLLLNRINYVTQQNIVNVSISWKEKKRAPLRHWLGKWHFPLDPSFLHALAWIIHRFYQSFTSLVNDKTLPRGLLFYYCLVLRVSQHEKYQTSSCPTFPWRNMLDSPDAAVQSGTCGFTGSCLYVSGTHHYRNFFHLLQRARTNWKNKTSYNKTMINPISV